MINHSRLTTGIHAVMTMIRRRHSRKARIRVEEGRLIRQLREAVYSRLVREGATPEHPPGPERAALMVAATFQRCGVVARALEAELNQALGCQQFKLKSLGGHYVVQSSASGLIYDLVSTQGLQESDKGELDFARYLQELETLPAGSGKVNQALQKYVIQYMEGA